MIRYYNKNSFQLMNHYKQLIKQYFYKKRLSNEFIKLIENKVINYQEMDNQLHLFIVDNSLSIFNKIIITKNYHSYINYILLHNRNHKM